MRKKTKMTALLLATLLALAGCGKAPAPAPDAATPWPSDEPAASTPAWQEPSVDNPLDDWFDDGAFEGAPGAASVYERAYDALALVETEGLAVYLEAVRYVENYAMAFALRVENTSELDLTLRADDVAVNGWMQDAILMPLRAISAGESAVCTLELAGLTLAAFSYMEIRAVASLQFSLTVTEREGEPFGTFLIEADALDPDAAAQTYRDAGTELLTGPVRAVYTGFDEEGYSMLFYAENDTDARVVMEITPQYNGSVTGTVCERALAPHCRAVLQLLPFETLYEQGQQELFFAQVQVALDGAEPVMIELF